MHQMLGLWDIGQNVKGHATFSKIFNRGVKFWKCSDFDETGLKLTYISQTKHLVYLVSLTFLFLEMQALTWYITQHDWSIFIFLY